ncbi:hypothetical protein POM88_032086 [Heracleum sosnowskyi]|uniref:Uncharacterized protein n=1 Tax=Heracleum sosnowskyi TaxID=360622 RepID=A0AAD8HZG3_9APIA|nr:hypothetical protein POM88_032086 [Heracleum sosnowskyi]
MMLKLKKFTQKPFTQDNNQIKPNQIWSTHLFMLAVTSMKYNFIVQSARPYGHRAVLKFAQTTGASAIAGRNTPATFTNQLQTLFSEPRLLVLTDPELITRLVSV